MILTSLSITADEFEAATGWAIKPEGACRDDRCVPLDGVSRDPLDVATVSARLNMPIVHDEALGLYALGPESGGRALTSAIAPDLRLPDYKGGEFRLSSLKGRKKLLVAWASW